MSSKRRDYGCKRNLRNHVVLEVVHISSRGSEYILFTPLLNLGKTLHNLQYELICQYVLMSTYECPWAPTPYSPSWDIPNPTAEDIFHWETSSREIHWWSTWQSTSYFVLVWKYPPNFMEAKSINSPPNVMLFQGPSMVYACVNVNGLVSRVSREKYTSIYCC